MEQLGAQNPPDVCLCVVCVVQVQMAVDVRFAQDTLRGDNVTEIRMKFIKRIEENLPAGDE